MSIIENKGPTPLDSLFSVGNDEPRTGTEIMHADPTNKYMMHALHIASLAGACAQHAIYPDVRLVFALGNDMDDDLVDAAERLRASHTSVIEDLPVEGPKDKENYVWRHVNKHLYLVFEMDGVHGILAKDLINEMCAE